MAKLALKVPSFDEMSYRKQILADEQTMAYNAGYDQEVAGYNYNTGTIQLDPEQWKKWYNNWVDNEPDRYYAYIMLEDKPIGEVSYHYNVDLDCYLVRILLEFNYRGKGYSEEAIRLLMDVVFTKTKVKKLGDKIPEDRTSAIKAFKKVGFIEEDLHISDIKFGKKEKMKYIEITRFRYLLKRKKNK